MGACGAVASLSLHCVRGSNALPYPASPTAHAAALNSKEAAEAFAAGGGGKRAQAERMLAEAKAAAAAAAGTGGKGAGGAAAAKQPQPAAAAGGSDPRLRSAPRKDVSAKCAQWVEAGYLHKCASSCICKPCVCLAQAASTRGLFAPAASGRVRPPGTQMSRGRPAPLLVVPRRSR